MDNYYVISCGSYSDYEISFIFKSPNVITEEQLKTYYLESIKRSSDFDDKQTEKIAKFLNDGSIKSTNYYNRFSVFSGEKPTISFKDWQKLCNDVGVEENPHNWLERILTENGCEIISFNEFNTGDWD